MAKLSIDDLNLKGKKVIIRVDFNVPLVEGKVGDDTRIVRSLPTIQKVLDEGGIPIIISHLGRPKGKKDPTLSLKPVAKALDKLLGHKVSFVTDCVGDKVNKALKTAKEGDCYLLENLRFHAEEKDNDENFAKALASHGDLFINDAFGAAHRAHASVVGIPKFIKDSAAGYLMKKELDYFAKVLGNPKRPFVALVGGAKISNKIEVILNLLNKVDRLLLGGGLVYTFYKVLGVEIGDSIFEEESMGVAAEILQKSEEEGGKIILPIDCVITNEISDEGTKRVVFWEDIPPQMCGVDIGPDTSQIYVDEILRASTVTMNGPMGVYEVEAFSEGTREVISALAEVKKLGGISVIGGGESAAAVKLFGYENSISHISTGGGASLELMEGKELPGIAALKDV